jgi:hypothetical protein
MAKLELVGTHEIEQLHGIPRYKVFRLVDRGLLPKPYQELRCGAVWDKAKVATAVARL